MPIARLSLKVKSIMLKNLSRILKTDIGLNIMISVFLHLGLYSGLMLENKTQVLAESNFFFFFWSDTFLCVIVSIYRKPTAPDAKYSSRLGQ